MRDPVLYPFYSDISSLPGVGPKARPVLARLIGGDRERHQLFELRVVNVNMYAKGKGSSVPSDNQAREK